MANSKALDKLLSKTLRGEHGQLRKRKLGRAEKRLRQQHRQEKLRKNTLVNPKKKSLNRPPKSETADEIEHLKKEIVKELGTEDPYIKRQFRSQLTTWEGLTPGLAPIGYDPDESDYEDPY